MASNGWWYIYRHWLMDQVDFGGRRGFNSMFIALHDVEFTWVIPMDRNREDDGLALRERFYDEKGIKEDVLMSYSCSVLEMLVAFAIRIDTEWIGSPKDPRPGVIFEEMLKNLNAFYNDYDMPEPGIVEARIYKWLDRDFDRQGNGSIFPIRKRRCKDQRKIEIWEQMMSYISENYKF